MDDLTLEARAECYRLLAAVFVREPGPREVEEFLSFSWGVRPDLPGGHVGDSDFESIAAENRCEFARMFLGPKALVAPPYESAYRGLESRLALSRFFAEVGLAVDGSVKEPEDFLGFELQCAMHLLNVASLARSAGERDAEEDSLGLYEEFLAGHLSEWIPLFCQRIRNGSPSWFIAFAADVLEDFVASEVDRTNRAS